MHKIMETRLRITRCPNCGSDQIRLLTQDWISEFAHQVYVVPDLEFYQCPQCGERVYDREAMRKIEAYSPAFAQRQVVAEVDELVLA
ncbi:MAG: YgiT-type zinc finger protein [Anaerolineae bacterium]